MIPYWHFPAITRNKYGTGRLTYEGTFLSDALQRAVVKEVLKHSGLGSPDEDLPESVRVRHGRNRRGKLLHYYFNYSGQEQAIPYSSGTGSDLLTGEPARHGQMLKLKLWDLAIIEER